MYKKKKYILIYMEDPYSLFKGNPHLKIYYFIGRLNPPHEGHVMALIQMIETANADGSVPLILIGSGPKGLRTMDNPVTFETKTEFLKYRLPPHLKYAVRPLKNPLEEVTSWYHDVLPHVNEPQKVSFIRFAGDKGDNATKFKHLDNRFEKLHAAANSRTVPIKPVMATASKEMSATIVRKTAYTCLLNEMKGLGDGVSMFRQQYGKFYGDFCEHIYTEIIEVVQGLSPEDIQMYVDTTKLPKNKTSKSKKSGKASKSKSKKSKGTANSGSSSNNSP